MNRKILIYMLILLILILFFYLLFFFLRKIKKTNTLELTYESASGVPYKWEFEIKDRDIVSYISKKDITDPKYKELDGGPIYTNYIFQGRKQGETTITFRYVSITTGEVEKEEVVNVKVDKYKHISLVGTSK